MSTICNHATEPVECCPKEYISDAAHTSDIENAISPTTIAALSLLALATFVYGTFELYPVGLINDIAASLHVNTGKIGLLVTGYAIVAGIVTIPSVKIATRVKRKTALIISLSALLIAEIVTSLAMNYPLLLASRIIASLTHGILWSLIIPQATSLVPKNRMNMAIAIVFAGTSAAFILGSPLTTLLGGAIGWHATALVLAVITALAIMGLSLLLPHKTTETTHSLESSQHIDHTVHRNVHWDKVTWICVFLIIIILGHFVSYTYFAVIIIHDLHSQAAVVGLLAVFGIMGGIATFFIGKYGDAHPVRATIISVAAFTLGTALLALAASNLAVVEEYIILILATVLWGAGYAAIMPLYQAAVVRVSGPKQDIASAIYVTSFQIGISAGSAIGAAIIVISLNALTFITFVLSVIVLLGTITLRKIYQ